MLATINLDDQLFLTADKIGDIMPYLHLPAEFPTV